jgi:hypothetical protein
MRHSFVSLLPDSGAPVEGISCLDAKVCRCQGSSVGVVAQVVTQYGRVGNQPAAA